MKKFLKSSRERGMRMEKIIMINLSNIEFKGDVLDFGGVGSGVIYNISKKADDEMAIDIVEGKSVPEVNSYDTVVIFFLLSKFFSKVERKKIVIEAYKYLKDFGELYIWDINKQKGKVFSNRIRAIINRDNIREFVIREFNPLKESNMDETKKNLENYFKIVDTKKWEDIYFIKAIKKGS